MRQHGGRLATQPGGTPASSEGDEYAKGSTPFVIIAGKEYGTWLVARLGGSWHHAAGRPRRHRREL
jgi:hypothetical protein